MNHMKIYLLGLIICLQALLMDNAIAQTSDCADQVSFKVVEGEESVFEIEIKLKENSQEDFSLELYNLTDGQKLVDKKPINNSSNIISFRNLNADHVYLIQAKGEKCTFTLGGLNGIKVENK